jgi:thiol peroxidase
LRLAALTPVTALVLGGCQTGEPFPVATATVAPGSAITWNGEAAPFDPPTQGLSVGNPVPPVVLTSLRMQPEALLAGARVRILSVVPSLDTPVCDVQTHTLGETSALSPAIERVTISADLPYAQRRFAAEAKLEGIRYLSDYRDLAFGRATGLRLARNGLLARAVVVVDQAGIVRYLQVVPEITELPDMAKAFAAANALVDSRPGH